MSQTVGEAVVNIRTKDLGTDGDFKRKGTSAGEDYGKGFGSSVKKVIGLALAGVAAAKAIDFAKQSVAEARESQKVGAATAQIIKSTGGLAQVTAKQVGQLTTAISNKSGVDDEAIQSGSNLILTFTNVRNEVGKGNDVFNQATQAAVDLSAAGFGSITGASVQLGKALNDPIKGISALAKSGVTFSAQQQATIKSMVASGNILGAQKIILAGVQTQVGGVAAATATAGEKSAVAYGNIKEAIGGVLLPVLDTLEKVFVNQVAPAIFQTIAGAQALAPVLKDAASTAVELFKSSGAGEFLGLLLRAIPQVIGLVESSLVPAFRAISKQIVPALAEIGPALGTVGTLVRTQLVPAFSGVVSQIGPILSQLGTIIAAEVVPTVADLIGLFTSKVIPTVVMVAGVIATNLVPIFRDVVTVVRNNILPAVAVLVSTFDTQVVPAIGKVVTAAGYIAAKLIPVFAQIAHIVLTQVVPTLITLYTFVATKLVPILIQTAEAIITKLKPVFDQLVATFQTQVLPTIQRAIIQIRTQLIPALEPVVVVVVKVIGFLLKLAAAILGKLLPPLIRVAGFILANVIPAIIGIVVIAVRVIGAIIKISEAIGRFVGALTQATGHVVGFGKSLVSGVTNAFDSVVRAIGKAPGAILALGGKFLSAGKTIIGKLISGLTGGGKFISNIAGNVYGALKGMLDSAIDHINAALEFSINTHIPGVGTVTINPPNIPHLARGTTSFAGGVAWVGEEGPELVRLPAGAGVTPAAASAAQASGTTITIGTLMPHNYSEFQRDIEQRSRVSQLGGPRRAVIPA